MNNRLAKVKVLCSYLPHKGSVDNALRCIQVDSHHQAAVQDWLRESGQLQLIETLTRSNNVNTRRLAIYCLSSCVGSNLESQSVVSRLSLFNELYTTLEDSGVSRLQSADQYVCLTLLYSLCRGNPCGQELANTSGCVHIVMEICGHLLRKPTSLQDTVDIYEKTFPILVLRCLKSFTSTPSHVLNQQAVSMHPVYCAQVISALHTCKVSSSGLLEYLCELVAAVYSDTDRDAMIPYRDAIICTLCSKVQLISTSRRDTHSVRMQSSLAVLMKSLLSLVTSDVKLRAAAEESLDVLCPRLVRISAKLANPELRQSVLFLLLSVLDRPGSNHEPLLKGGGVRRLHLLTKSTDDPLTHCSVSYILLGLQKLTADEMDVVRQLTPGCLVRLGLPLDQAKELSLDKRIIASTRKQLFETSDIMELISSDEEAVEPERSTSQLCRTAGDTSAVSDQHRAHQQWVQLTPPSKVRTISSSPGWKARVKRLRSVLKQRGNRIRAASENLDCAKGRHVEKSAGHVRAPLQLVNG